MWLTITFAAILGMGRTFVREYERGTLAGLLLAPVDRGTLFIAKLLANLIFLFIMEAVTLPMFALLFNLPVLRPSVILITALGTLGFAILGTIFSAMAAHSRAREACAAAPALAHYRAGAYWLSKSDNERDQRHRRRDAMDRPADCLRHNLSYPFVPPICTCS